MAKFIIAAALTTTVAAVPLPRPDGVDHTADEVRMELSHQIREHHRYVVKMRALWRERRQAVAEKAAQAASVPSSTTTSTPTTTYTSTGGWSEELLAVGFPESAISTMLYIIDRESGGCPTAVYGYGCDGVGHAYAGGPACGLTQLWPCPGPQALDPMTNLSYAFQKYQASGFAPWSM